MPRSPLLFRLSILQQYGGPRQTGPKTGRQVTMLKATIERRYKDRDGQWRSSSSFSRNEILLAMYCVQKSFDHIIEGRKDEDGSVEEETVY